MQREAQTAQAPTPVPDEKKLELGDLRGAMDKNVLSDAEDWETVVTSAAGFGDGRRSFPTRSMIVEGGIKATGSSIADISDDTSYLSDIADDMGSTDRIIQHPSGDDSQGYRLRHLKGSNMPVFLAKQRMHKVNGFAQDSYRTFDPQGTKVGPVAYKADALVRKVSNPFRRVSLGRKHHFSPLSSRKSHRVAKLANRHSRNSDELWDRKRIRSEKCDVDQRRHPVGRDGLASLDKARPVGNAASPGNETREAGDHSGKPHGFSFNLISLPEAARLQAFRRESGMEDQTETGVARSRHAVSTTSSKHVNLAGATTTNLPQVPDTSHQRRPTALFSLSSPMYSRTGERRDEGKTTSSPLPPSRSLSS